MTVGSMIVKRDPPMTCSRCGHEIPKGETAWYTKGKRGYWCQGCQDDWVQKNTSGQPASREQMTTTAAAAEQNAPRLSKREEDIARAHQQNMESAKQMRNEMALLASSIRGMTTVLEQYLVMWRKVQEADAKFVVEHKEG